MLAFLEFCRRYKAHPNAPGRLRILVDVNCDWRGQGAHLKPSAVEDASKRFAIQIQLVDLAQIRTAPSRSQSFTRELGKRQDKVLERRVPDIEGMHIEVKSLSGWKRFPIKMSGTKDEGTRPIRQSAWTLVVGRLGFEDSRIGTRLTYVASLCISTIGHTDQSAEYAAKSSADYVARLVWREIERIGGEKPKAESMELKRHPRSA